MKYQLAGHGWPIGQWLIPVGTVIDHTKTPEQMTDWEKLALGKLPPLNAVALDDDCAEAMANGYPGHRHLLHKARGVNANASVPTRPASPRVVKQELEAELMTHLKKENDK
jgi:hypothetical protein